MAPAKKEDEGKKDGGVRCRAAQVWGEKLQPEKRDDGTDV